MPEVKVEILIHLFIKETYIVTTMHLYVSGLRVAHNYNKNVKETIKKYSIQTLQKQQHVHKVKRNYRKII